MKKKRWRNEQEMKKKFRKEKKKRTNPWSLLSTDSSSSLFSSSRIWNLAAPRVAEVEAAGDSARGLISGLSLSTWDFSLLGWLLRTCAIRLMGLENTLITSFAQNGQLKSPFVLSTNKVFPSKSLSSSTVWWSLECDARVLLISLRQISHQNPILTPTDVRRERELKRKKRVGETGNENEKKKWCYGFSFSFSCFFFIFFFLGFDSHLLVIW